MHHLFAVLAVAVAVVAHMHGLEHDHAFEFVWTLNDLAELVVAHKAE